jgi:DNA-binding NarL/FixJ family response regulator
MQLARPNSDFGTVLEPSRLPAPERRALANVLHDLGELLMAHARLLHHGVAMERASDRRALLHAVPAPDPWLPPRERVVATRIAHGLSNRQIALELVITNSTVERHVANILGKLNMRSRAQVAVWAVCEGLG